MPRIPQGSGATLAFQVFQADGKTPMDATNPVVTMRRPWLAGVPQADVTYSGGEITHLDTGSYTVAVPKTDVAVIGHYPWVVTADSPDGVLAGKSLDVFDPFAPALLTLNEAKQALQKTAGRTINDDELQIVVDTATEQIEKMVGPVVPRTVTVTAHPIDHRRIWPDAGPVLAVESATWWDQPLDVTGWTVDTVTQRWLIVPQTSYYARRWYRGCSDLMTTIRVGREPIPASLPLAGRILVQHLWQPQRSGTGAAAAGLDVVETGYGFAIPNRVAELVRPFSDEWGIA